MDVVRWHVVPTGDYKPHIVSLNCHCSPHYDGEVVIHHALDLREIKERQGRPTGKGWIIIGEET